MKDILVWEDAASDEPGVQYAESFHRVAPDSTSAYYSLVSNGADRWSVELIQVKDGETVGTTSLGVHDTESDAKVTAGQHEMAVPDDDAVTETLWFTATVRVSRTDWLATFGIDEVGDDLRNYVENIIVCGLPNEGVFGNGEVRSVVTVNVAPQL